MKYNTTAVTSTKEILHNDHWVGIPYDCSAIATNDKGIIPAGTIIPANDATAFGVLLNDVEPASNPNGTVVIHGFVRKNKLPVQPASTVNIPMVKFMD